MTHRVNDVFTTVSDNLNAGCVVVTVPAGSGPVFTFEGDPESGFTFNETVDQDVVELQLREFRTRALFLFVEAALPSGHAALDLFMVLPDGRWHVDMYQAYLMQEDEPHLTPHEWVERLIALKKSGLRR